MFEYKLQKSWENYKQDLGLGRITLFVGFFSIFLFLFTLIFLQELRYSFLFPVVFVYVLSFFNKLISKQRNVFKFSITCLFLALIIPFLYHQTGIVDEASDGLGRFDTIFAQFDYLVFGQSVANFIQMKVGNGFFATLFYDWVQTSYHFYFIFPFYGAIVYYRRLSNENIYKIARLSSSIAIFFSINFFLYIAIPVTGPQYFMPSAFTISLPLSSYGNYLHSLISNGQPTYIDCFPSGHTGISVLMSIWFYKMKSRHLYFSLFMLLSIVSATLALRYHYVLDIIFAIPLAFFCYHISWIIIPESVYRRPRK